MTRNYGLRDVYNVPSDRLSTLVIPSVIGVTAALAIKSGYVTNESGN
ncbi:MAG TPA: hypothetical protein VGQ13_02605 [Nitrososphaera sp.]|jgi:hypothetical protein|nr:hypothetical protein [Nitrososphaera sp.]